MGYSREIPEINERLRIMFFPTLAELEEQRMEHARRDEERKRREAVQAEMGHAEALWGRIVRRWASKRDQ